MARSPLLRDLSRIAVSVSAAAAAVSALGAGAASIAGVQGIPPAIPTLLGVTALVQGLCAREAGRTPLGGTASAAAWILSDLALFLASPPEVGRVISPLGLLLAALIGTVSAPPGTWAWGPVAALAWWVMLALSGAPIRDVAPISAFPAVIFIGTTLLVARMAHQLDRSERSLREALVAVEARSAEADRANRAKSDFLAGMSHELRTPLNAIIGYAELLVELADDHEVTADASRIVRAGRHLLALVNDLLDMAKIEAGRMSVELRPLAVRALLDELRPVAESLARQHGNQLQWDVDEATPAEIVADELRLRQIVLNLLGNAMKFTSAGHVRLWARSDATGFRLTVHDDGPGIDDELRARLFRPFEQGASRQGGSGLGLAISRELVTRMGGTLDLVSPPGPGAAFEVWLPRP